MKRIKLISITILTLISMVVSAQTTKTVGGSSANYRTLKAAFDAVNNGVLNGNIVFQIIANTTESATATLYQSGYGGLSSYSSVSVYPTVTGCTITGNLASALIDINGADNVIIDGRLNASGSTVDLTITNTSTSSAVGTCVVNFQNDATNNYLIWCNLKGAVTSINSGVVKIGGASGATGNNNIQISRNKITGTTSSNRPTNGIISIGNSTGNNSQITISYNEIFDIFNSASTTLGISVRDYSTDFDIIGNHIYETSTVTPSAGFSYYPIYISNTSGNGFLVQSNYIGGQTTYCGGGAFTKTNSWAHTFAAIYVNVGTSSASTISGNYVRNINWSNSDNVDFHGIQHVAGTVTISTNNIGESTGTGSLTYSCDSNHATGTGFYGIKAGLTGSVTIDQNVIGSITTSNPNDLATNIFAIYCGSGSTALEITSNTIGSNTTANSIYASSVSTTTAQSVRAITLGSSGTINIDGNLIANLTNGTTASSTSVDGRAGGIYIYKASGSLSITDNIIKEIKNSNANNVSSENHSVSGMLIFGGVAGVTISGNRISNLSNDFATFTGRVYGIYADLGTTTNNIHSNFIQGLTTSSATSLTNAIHLKAGVTSCYNNIINMGGNNACGLYGIYDHGAASQNVNIYHNTIYISGAPTSGSANSAGIYSNANSNNRNFRNNIVVNARSNNGSSGSHYAMYFAYATAGTLTLDYNDYQSTGTGGQLAYYNSANVNSIPLIASQDANSLNEGPLFASAGGTSAANYDPANTGLYGASGLGISTDYAGTTRTTPTCMGAYESPLSGTVDVYASAVLQATYSTLKAAFDAINAGTHTGALTIELNASTTETLTATLNASGSGSASYTSINIYPTTTGLSISGNLASPFIDLNGADNVTIDGREDATGSTKSLTIINTSTSTTGGTSTIRFINDASNNTVKYCTIKGSELVSTSGIIFFSTTTATNGNDNNTIEYNNITNSNDSNRPLNAIFSFGTSAKDNSNNTISNNNIYDFFNHATTSQGIYLSSFTTNWTISNNHFYETASFSPTASVAYKVIYLNNTSGNNFTVSDNYIGGSTTSCGGSEWTKPLGQNNSFAGIYLSVGTATASNINGNTITNFNWSNSGGSHWNAFYHVAGNVNIGTTVGNTIGATTGNGAITCGSNSSGFSIVGLMINGTGNINFSNNTFGSITAANTNATLAVGVFGVYSNASSGTNVFTNNLIGSTTTTNSIYISSVSSTEAQPIHGFYLITTGTNTLSNNIIVNINNNTTNTTASTYGAVSGIFLSGGTNNVYNNTIRDLTIANANNSTVTTASVNGIVLASSSYVNTVYNNTIYNLSNTYASFAGQIAGIYFMGSTGANSCYKNFIHSLSATGASSTEASIYGIKAVTGVTTYYNNIINLGGNTITTIYGIYDAGAASQTFNAYHNSIYIGGTLISGSTNKSYCLFSAAASNTRKINNNILQNSRSTTSGASLHYAISQTANTNLDCNYNDYYTTGTGGVLGIMTTDRTTLAAWQFATSGDDVSLNENPAFASAGGTAATDYIPAHTGLFGITSLGISTDYAANSRTVNFTMGAYETDLSFPVEIWKTGVEQESFATLKAAFDAINAGTHTGALTIKINSSTTESASAVLNASGSGAASYTSVNIYPTTTGLILS